MQFHRDKNDSLNIIQAYGDEGIRINDKMLSTPCIISPTTIIDDWTTKTVVSLTASDLKPVIELQTELIILGVGKTLRFPNADIGPAINQHGTGFEFMDSAAACRTYNLLVHEGRSVAVVLLAEPDD